MFAQEWWNNSYPYRYPIISDLAKEYPLSVNDSFGISNNIIWSYIGDDSYVYCENSGCGSGLVAIANETNQKYWENETSRTGNNPTSVWDSNYVGIWHFGECSGSTFYDSTNNGNNGNMNSGIYNPDGKFGCAGFTDGSDDKLTIPHSSSLNLGQTTDSYTIDFWVKIYEWDGIRPVTLIEKLGPFTVYVLSADHPNAYAIQFYMCSQYCNSLTRLELNKWYHIGLVKNYTTHKLYIYLNGSEDVNCPYTNSYTSNNDIDIGYSAVQTYSKIMIDELRISNTSRDADYFSTVYKNGINTLTRLGAEEVILKIDFLSPSTPSNNTIQNSNTLVVNTSINSFYSGNYNFYINDIVEEIGSFSDGNTQINLTKLLPDGTHNYYVAINDTRGGKSQTEKRFIIINTTPPILSNSKPNNKGFFNNPSSLLFQVDLTEPHFDISEGVKLYYRRKNVGNYQLDTLTCYGSSPFYTCDKTKDLSSIITDNETLQFFFNTIDILGNIGELGNQSYPLTATVDMTEPTSPKNVNFEPDPSYYYDNDGIIVVNWSPASDSISGIKEYKIYVNENNTGYVFNGTNTSITGYQFIGSEASNYSVRVTSVDLADNENTTGTISSTTITVDTIEPRINIDIPRNKTYYNLRSLPLDFGIFEPTSPVSWCGYSLDGNANITILNCDNITTLTHLSYTIQHHLIVYANDSAGNMGSSEVYFNINSTCSGPISLTFNPNPVNYTTNKNVTAISSGLSNCDEINVTVKDVPCEYSYGAKCTCLTYGSGCSCQFPTPSIGGYYTYYACLDMNQNGKYDNGEYGTKQLQVLCRSSGQSCNANIICCKGYSCQSGVCKPTGGGGGGRVIDK